MKDALSAVRQFTSEGNLSRNGNLNTTTMKEMWDYESWEPFSGKIRDISEKALEKSKSSQVKSNNECELCGGNHKVEQCPHERKFSLGSGGGPLSVWVMTLRLWIFGGDASSLKEINNIDNIKKKEKFHI